MSNTYVARHTTDNGWDTRNSATKAYTHALMGVDEAGEGPISWHTSSALARKAKDAAAKWYEGTMTVVKVEVREGTKAKVERDLAAEAEAAAAKPAKAPAKGKAAAKPAKVEEPTVEAKAPKGLELAQANIAAAKANGGPVHPGLLWRERVFLAGQTQTTVAEAMGVAGMTLNRVFNGRGLPTVNLTVRFAKALDLDVHELWTEVAEYELAAELAS